MYLCFQKIELMKSEKKEEIDTITKEQDTQSNLKYTDKISYK